MAQSYGGSTALQQLLMSSRRVTFPCRLGTHVCEGAWAMQERGNFGAGGPGWNYSYMLELYGIAWNIKQPVLADKSPSHNFGQLEEMYDGLQRLANAPPLPGVRYFDLAYIFMWRTWCMVALSSHATDDGGRRGGPFDAEAITNELETHVKNHRLLLERRARVLVISFERLLWAPASVSAAVSRFLPCAGAFDANYFFDKGTRAARARMTPLGNNWKVQSSVAEYGRQRNCTQCCGLSDGCRRCDAAHLPLVSAASGAGAAGAAERAALLQSISRQFALNERLKQRYEVARRYLESVSVPWPR